MAHEPYFWQDRAACRSHPLARFFYDMSSDPVNLPRRLREICSSCPVFDDCRTYIDFIENGQAQSRCHGFWAAETVKQRLARRREERGHGIQPPTQDPD